MKTSELIQLRKRIDYELYHRYHISLLPFHIIATHILSRLDWYTRIMFLYTVQVYFKNDAEFLHHFKSNFLMGSIHDAIQHYSQHFFITCRFPSTQHIFSHWSPFSRSRSLPLATLHWIPMHPFIQLTINDRIITRHVAYLMKRKIGQARLSVHEECHVQSMYTSNISCRFRSIRIYSFPSCILTANPFQRYYYHPDITLESAICS